ncbi:MAG: hypothetical protein LBT35_02205, partial [Tannerella sp.]|nr:hypothetical protein [Tannerella sp.]
MRKRTLIITLLWLAITVNAQKKQLDHDAYDAWESVAQALVSNDGRYAVYIVAPQEGDSMMYVKDLKTMAEKRIERGFGPQISDDSRYLVFKIKPSQAEKKDARKKKRKADEQPKDSLGWLQLGTQDVFRQPEVKAYKMPEKASNYFAYQTAMPKDTAKNRKDEKHDYLIVYFLESGARDTISFIDDYAVSKNGKYFAYTTKPSEKDSAAVPGVYLYDLSKRLSTLLQEGKGDYKLQAFDEDAVQFVFFATTDTTKRDPKVYNLYYTRTDRPEARIIADTLSAQMPENWAVNTSRTSFSRDGKKLYFGISPIIAPKDTTIDASEQAQLDIWHYQDDYLQTVQLKQLRQELNRSYLCVFDVNDLS